MAEAGISGPFGGVAGPPIGVNDSSPGQVVSDGSFHWWTFTAPTEGMYSFETADSTLAGGSAGLVTRVIVRGISGTVGTQLYWQTHPIETKLGWTGVDLSAGAVIRVGVETVYLDPTDTRPITLVLRSLGAGAATLVQEPPELIGTATLDSSQGNILVLPPGARDGDYLVAGIVSNASYNWPSLGLTSTQPNSIAFAHHGSTSFRSAEEMNAYGNNYDIADIHWGHQLFVGDLGGSVLRQSTYTVDWGSRYGQPSNSATGVAALAVYRMRGAGPVREAGIEGVRIRVDRWYQGATPFYNSESLIEKVGADYRLKPMTTLRADLMTMPKDGDVVLGVLTQRGCGPWEDEHFTSLVTPTELAEVPGVQLFVGEHPGQLGYERALPTGEGDGHLALMISIPRQDWRLSPPLTISGDLKYSRSAFIST